MTETLTPIEPALAVERAPTRAELDARLDEILAAPKDAGTVEGLVLRPEYGHRETPDALRLTALQGVVGDHWSRECWKTRPDGSPDPEVQVSLSMAGAMRAIAGPDKARWWAAGDNLVLEFDLTPRNAPPGTRLRVGEAVLEISEEPNLGCSAFVERYGREACAFVATGPGREHRLRGVFARVIEDGVVRLGDRIAKIG